jgi:molybdenum cofactor biosynthesis enzyme MoaA
MLVSDTKAKLVDVLRGMTYRTKERLTVEDRCSLYKMLCMHHASMGYTHFVDNIIYPDDVEFVVKYFQDEGVNAEYFPMAGKILFRW